MAGPNKTRSRAFARKAVNDDDRRVLGKHVDEFVRNANRVFAIFGASERVQASFDLQMRKHLLKADYAWYVSQAKAFCAYARAVQLCNEVPNFSLEFSGRFRRWFRRRLNVKCAQNRHFCNSVWNLKNTAASLHHKEVKRLMEEHAVDVAKEFDVEVELVQEFVDAMEPVLTKVAERALEIFDEQKVELYTLPGSNKASLLSSNRDGGEVGELIRDCFPYGSDVAPGFPLNHPQVRNYHPGSHLNHDVWRRSPIFEAWYTSRGFDSRDGKKVEKELQIFCECDYLHWDDTCRPKDLRYVPAAVFQSTVVVPGLVELVDGELIPFDSHLPLDEPTMVAPGYYEEFTRTKECPTGFWQRCTRDSHTKFDHHLWWVSVSEEPVVVGYEVIDDVVAGTYVSQPIQTYPRCQLVWNEFVDDAINDCLDLPTCRWQDFDPEDYPDDWDAPLSMVRRVVAICEPLKVRVITVGPAAQKYLLGMWQRCVHGALKSIGGFELLGAPPTTVDIEAILPGLDGQDLISSGDFKGASNGTPIRLNLALCHHVSRKLPEWMRRLSNNSCLPHLLVYGPLKTAVQRIGTLMGERTSFPLLSLTVAGAVVLTCRRRRVKLGAFEILRRVRNNGDDLVFRSTKDFADHYWSVTRELGFTKSVGKSYEHPNYANINSASFWCSDIVVRERGLFSGLFCGKKKLATDEFRPGEVVTELLDSCYDAKMEHTVMRAFLSRFGKALKQSLGGRNLFVSGLLGGMGQRRPHDFVTQDGRAISWHVHYSDEQRRVAQYLYETNPYIRRGARLGGLSAGLSPKRSPWDVEGEMTYWELETKMRRTVYGQGPSTLSIREYMLQKGCFIGRSNPMRRLGAVYLRSDFVRPGTIDEPPSDWVCQVCGEINPPAKGPRDRCSLCDQPASETMKLQSDPTFFGPQLVYVKSGTHEFTSWSYFERAKSSLMAVGPPPKIRRVLIGDESPKRLLARF